MNIPQDGATTSPVYFPISLTVPIGASKGTSVNVFYLPLSMTMEALIVAFGSDCTSFIFV